MTYPLDRINYTQCTRCNRLGVNAELGDVCMAWLRDGGFCPGMMENVHKLTADRAEVAFRKAQDHLPAQRR